YISLLPDDILVSILSRLTLKEAAVTSNLSRRWRYLWTNVTGLDFDANETLDSIAANPKLRSSERPKYINWVNRVVRQHKGPTLNSVRICFDLDKTSKCAIDNWVKFAVAKRAQRLELDLLENGEILRQPMRNYTFPYKHFSQCKSSRTQSSISIGLKCLKSLSLKCVNVNVGFVLSSCPALQYLSIHGSGDLTNVKVSGSSLVLKYLEIVFCLGIDTIEITNVNLVSFSYLGPTIKLIISDVPMLDEISIGEGYSGLENNENIKVFAFPEFPNLKQLILKVGAWDDDSLLEFTSLIKACPILNRFVLQVCVF
ncbi:hypothetical protein MIMGU_mgv1a027146mg, partial [Erythranthe guttata]